MKPKVGVIYQDSSEERFVSTPKSELREVLIARLSATVWDSDHEHANAALLAVIEWHQPWHHWEQVFQPTYIGDRYEGLGCRSCSWKSDTDCPTIQAIAKAYGIEM